MSLSISLTGRSEVQFSVRGKRSQVGMEGAGLVMQGVPSKLLLTEFARCLKSHGYRPFGHNTFALENADVFMLVNLQKSRSSTAETLECSVNLAVYSKAIAQHLGYTRRPIITDCHWHASIQEVMPNPSDTWWIISNEREAAVIGREITEAIERFGLPALATVDSTEKLRSLWSAGQGRGLSKGKRLECLRILQELDSRLV